MELSFIISSGNIYSLKDYTKYTCVVYQSMKCCRVFRDGFPRQSWIPQYSVFRDGKHDIPRWGLKKHAHPNVVGNVKKTRCALCIYPLLGHILKNY